MFNTVPDTKSNPIFSSYSVQDANFNENMDEYIKAPNDIYIEQQQKNIKSNVPKRDINQDALNNIKERPAFLKEEFDYVYKKPEWLEELERNVATPEDIEEWKKKGAIGIGEVAKQAKKWGYATPYVGTSAEATMLIRNANTLRRLKNGEEVSPVDAELLYDFLREEKEKEVRGVTFAGKALDAIRVGGGYMAEFGLGLAAVPEAGVGLASIAKTLTTIGGRKAARKAVESALKETALKSAAPAATKKTLSLSAAKQIYKDTLAKTTGTKALANVGLKEGVQATLKGLPRAVGTSAAFGSTFMSPHLVGDIANRQLATGIYITDFGDAVLTDSENLALSIMKAFGSSTFDALTETAGWTFSPVANYFAKPIQKILPKKFFTEFEKLVSTRYGMAATQALKKYGYDGILEEMGEELLNRFLCQVFGINGLDEYNFDGFMNNVFYANDPSQWAVEALSFAAVGGGARLAAGAGSRITDEWKKRDYNRDVARLTERANRYLHSPEQFYLEQGLIKIDGSQSLAEQKLREVWDEKNIDKNLQDEVLKNMSETEIRSELKKAIETKAENTTPEEATKRIEKDLTKKFVDNKIFAKEKDAKTVAALFAAPLQKLSETTGMSLEEVMEEEMPEIQREAEQAARDNGRYVQVDGRIEEIFNELNELPDNFNDEKYLERLMKEVDILSKARDGILTDAEREEAIQFANLLQQNGEIEFANELKEILNIEGEEQLFQAASSAGAGNNEIEAAQKEWREKGTESEYFKRWFGDSKVSDWQGNPIVVYHGTENNFKIFKNLGKSRQIGANIGFFFTDSKDMAKQYADDKRVMPVYLSLQNPLIVEPDSTIEIFGEELEIKDAFDFLTQLGRIKSEQEIKEELIKQGYDGIILNNTNVDTRSYEDIHNVYIAFNPEQIKSVNNRGTFDTENPNIYFQRQIKDAEGQMKLFQDVMQLNLFQQQQIFSSDNTKETIQQEIKQSYTEKDVKEAKQNSSYEITDVGDSLLGNLKKNKKQYSWQELSEMNDLLRKKYLSKSYIYQLPSYEEFKQEGLSDKCIAFINNVYSKINAKPAKGYEKIEHQKIYFDSVLEIMDKTIGFVKGNSELIDNHNYGTDNSLFKIIFPDTENKKPYSIFRAYPEYNLKAIITGGNKLIEAFYLDYKTEKNLKTIIEKFNKTEPEKNKKETLSGWQKYFDIVEYRGNWVLADRKSGVIFSDRKMPTKELAEKLAENLYQFMNQNARSFEVDFSNLRNYIPRRLDNQNVKPEALIEVFGFRGINFGNWTKQSERQNFVNLAYDSLYDLAELLNLPPKALSLGGRLGLAFGAQGRSKAAGHFIPEFNEINLTRKSGAGSLAHEWWHALDFYFGDQSQDKEFSGVASLSLKNQGFLRDEVYTALMNLNEAIKYSPLTEEDFIARKNEYKNRYERIIQYTAKDIKTTFYRSKNSNKINELVDNIVNNALTIDFQENQDDKIMQQFIDLLEEKRKTFNNLSKLNSLLYQIKNLQRIDDIAKAQKKYSDYYTKATKLNDIEKGNGYWTQNTELGARAFASYILDKINQQNYKNEFLVRDEKEEKSFDLNVVAEIINAQLNGIKTDKTIQDATIEWYPAQPEERIRIFKAFDDLFTNLKTREENKNVILYQSENEPIQTNMIYDNISPRRLRNMNIKGAFVPAENLIELFKNADESTIIHEFAHWWLSRLEKYAPNSEELALDLEEVRKFVKNEGGAFTREQHEKFARGFEAYIRNGSARSNRLKKIFEDFKNALIQIYDSIKQLVYTENGQQYSFSEADVANLEKLFERLLTTENERIKKTVFDRCDDINERIKEIKARQEEEMKELDELWKGNIEANNRASDKKRKVEEYLELAETAVSRVPKEVREMQQRYKDATLSILSAATGMKKNVIANPRNWEKVQMALENADDKITTSGGMRAEWEEFYSDTGVSYDNDEIGGDYELAQQAFNVLTDGTYNFGNMNEDEIGRFYGKFEYLYNKVQTLKGEEKSTALEALYSLFGDMPSMPDEVVEDVVGKLDKIEVEYNEGQKEDFNRKRYPNIPVVQQLQHYVTNKLNDLRVYDPNVRYKVRITKSHNLYKTIKGATSVNATKRIIRKINEYVISDLENQAKSILYKEIQKQIKTSSKLVKVGTLKKGKFDWKTNSVFAELAEINKLKQKEAFSQYGAMVDIDKAAAGEERENNSDSPTSTSELKTDFQSNLKRKFLEYRSSKIKDLNLAATRSLLEDIMTLKFEGRRAKDAQELERQLQRDNMKTDLVQRVRELKGNRAATGIAKFIMGETFVTSEKTLANWETSLNALFGKDVAQRYSLLKLESEAEIYAWKRYSNFCKKAIEIYGLNNPVNIGQKAWNKFNEFIDFANNQPLVTLMQNYESEVYNYKEVTYSKETGQFVESGVQLSRAEIITLYAWAQNEELEQRIFTQYGVAQVQHMFEQVLTEEDKQFAWLLIDTCDSMYDDTNEVFIRTMGLSLPKVENYFPSKTVRIGSEIDMLHENMVRSSNPSFIKERKNCKRIKMKPEQPLSILLPHLNKTARYVILSERLNYLNAIFKDATVRAAIKEVFDGVETPDKIQAGSKVKGRKNKKQRTTGDRIHDTLLNQLGSSTFENYVRGLNTGKSWMDALATNYITSRIGGNLKVAIGQLTGMINYCEKMPTGMWAKGFAKCLKNPKETVKYMVENCDYLNARLAGNSMNEVMLKITDEADRFRTLRNFCITNTKYGDLIAISFGGKPYVDYLMSQGMTKEEAFDKFVEETMRAQQAGQASATSVWQKKMSENPWTRMLFAFNNTTLQFERKFVDAMASRARGEISNRELIKAILIYKVFNPVLFTTFLSNLSFMTLIRGLTGDDDDGVEKFGIDMLTSILFANLAAYGGTGVIASTIGSFLMTLLDKKEYKPFLKSVPIIGDVEKIGKNILMKNEITVSDWVDAMALVTDDLTGVPATRTVNSVSGIGDIANGNTAVGLLKLIGYGNYRANVAVTGEPPERNRK